MEAYVVKRSFQFRGTMWHAGQIVRLAAADAADAFVAAHVERIDCGEARDARTNYLGNGREVAKAADGGKRQAARAERGERRHGAAARQGGESAANGGADVRTELAKMGVPCPVNATEEELRVKYEQMKEATAGSSMIPNRPGETEK